MNHVVLGILAHVDAGKTTLSESILYHTGVVSKMGRVDKKDAYLDTYELEKERGITIFSKQAELLIEDRPVSLLDTPGHVDFSPEAERVLNVLDYCILVISAVDGVQSHTETLWKLLKRYNVPVFIFINKMDQFEGDKSELISLLKEKLAIECEEADTTEFMESVAAGEEALLEKYLEDSTLDDEDVVNAIRNRKIFPCFFGSALRDQGVDELLHGLYKYALPRTYGSEFGAKVFKISTDEKGVRLTHMKITSGSLKLKDVITYRHKETGEEMDEKVNRIYICSGAKETDVTSVEAGSICSIPGLEDTYPGQGLGVESDCLESVLTPVLTYAVKYPSTIDSRRMLQNLKQLEEEEPQLHVVWDEHLKEIQIQLMGEVQIEILKHEISKRFEIPVEFATGRIVYRETISDTVEGVGHYEPLRHYSEVHLLLEPGARGSGLVFQSKCSEDILNKNWQRLVLTHLEEKQHRGVLGGFPITDMVITLVAGRAHPKHTEGGDFRQATYRAVRHGLMKATGVLLEPVYAFTMKVPTSAVGRAMTDLNNLFATFEAPGVEGDFSVIEGVAPVATLNGYQTELVSYTSGLGKLECRLQGYEPCHNQEEVVKAMGYEPERDLRNSPDSVFCTHGAGFVVPWYEVENYMHIPLVIDGKSDTELKEYEMFLEAKKVQANAKRQEEERKILGVEQLDGDAAEKELKDIFEKTYGTITTKFNQDYIEDTRSRGTWNGKKKEKKEKGPVRKEKPKDYDYDKERRHKREGKVKKEKYLLVDGYNVIFAWKELKELADQNIEGARNKLMEILCNYQGYTGQNVILVYDAYKTKGHDTEVSTYRNISVVYTKEAETADQYIERCAHDLSDKHEVTVATSDGLEQVIIAGAGAILISARELEKEMERLSREFHQEKSGVQMEKITDSLSKFMPKDMR
ncbi:MAG: TetM/TetW/TetO/TetS family tetracycline resistance ribosomal protection protein [Lachnospiraceae bacterium]|nr:TetM/TetW/TetO/TetS family tetracycline resistance ribosomal protection protein [Lachnospiraceae bacterium]